MPSTPVNTTFAFAGRTVHRLGYGAMRLSGPHIFGPPKDRAAALNVLREAVAAGVDHIDTSDFMGRMSRIRSSARPCTLTRNRLSSGRRWARFAAMTLRGWLHRSRMTSGERCTTTCATSGLMCWMS